MIYICTAKYELFSTHLHTTRKINFGDASLVTIVQDNNY
jgi:hypothetical protein